MGIHHLLTYNISIQYVLVIHVHVTYRVCTSEVKTDEEKEELVSIFDEINNNKEEAESKEGESGS